MSTTPDETVVRAVSTDTTKPSLCLVGDSRVAMLPATLFDAWGITNYGVGGTTSYYTACVLVNLVNSNARFDTVIISVGVNDCIADLTIEASINSLQVAVACAKQIADHVFITTVPGVTMSSIFTAKQATWRSQQSAVLSAWINVIAQNAGIVSIPLATTLNDQTWGYGWFLNIAYTDLSGIHYSSAGYAALGELYRTYIEEGADDATIE